MNSFFRNKNITNGCSRYTPKLYLPKLCSNELLSRYFLIRFTSELLTRMRKINIVHKKPGLDSIWNEELDVL